MNISMTGSQVATYCLLIKSIFYILVGVGCSFFMSISYLDIYSKSRFVSLDAAATIFYRDVCWGWIARLDG